MYKRKGCELFTIERKDFLEKYFGGVAYRGNKFNLYGMIFHKDTKILDQLDIILEVNGVRYLGYWDFPEGYTVEDFKKSFVEELNKDFSMVNFIVFVIVESNYLESMVIEKEIEYVYEE